MELGLAGKSVVVTGAASNIGRAIALAFAAEKVKVTIVDLDVTAAERVAALARERGAAAANVVRADVTNWESVQAMVKEVETRHGAIDVLVNNVGWTFDALFTEKKREDWEKEVNLNFWSVINCTRAVLDGMIARKSGAIVNIGSDAGRMGEFREAVYAGTKGGVIAMTKSLARELGRNGIRLNVVCPGTTMPASDEEMSENSIWRDPGLKSWNTDEMRAKIGKAYPMRRVGKPEDISAAVVFMASSAASFITGQTLSVSGGYTMM
jgi:2-hydroxycyclohexanecarboxyl-CoA dehydrogenase